MAMQKKNGNFFLPKNGLPRQFVGSLSMEILKMLLDTALSNLL